MLAPTGCGHSSSPASSGNTGAVARFDVTTNPTPNFLDVPFPSDVYLQGGQVTTIPGVDAIVKENSNFITHELAKMDGFSRIALAMFYVDDFSAPLDDSGNVAFAQLDPDHVPDRRDRVRRRTRARCTSSTSTRPIRRRRASPAARCTTRTT